MSRHVYRSKNAGNSKDGIKSAIKLPQHLAPTLGVKVDTDSQGFIEKVDSW